MIAAFDLEGTLSTGATWIGVGEYLKAQGHKLRYGAFFAAHVPGALLVRSGLKAEQPYKEQWMVDLARLLRGYDQRKLDEMGEWVVEHEMWPQRRADVLALLADHIARGDRVIVASGTYQPVIDAFARRTGVTETLGTPFAMQNGHASGRVASAMNTGQDKIAALRAYLQGGAPDTAYGDTAADIPMLSAAKEPVAIYPDEGLRAHAEAHGWRIFEG